MPCRTAPSYTSALPASWTEIEFYTSGAFKPTELIFHSKDAHVYGDTAVVITDCDYGLLLGGKPTTHHFAVTEVYSLIEGEWKLVQFSFTALVYPSKSKEA